LFKNHEDFEQYGTFRRGFAFNTVEGLHGLSYLIATGQERLPMDIFIVFLVVAFLVLFALMSLPIANSDSLDDRHPTQPFKK
jgi:hypothetical protein